MISSNTATIQPMQIDLGPFPDLPGYDRARELDGTDPLGPFRGRFLFSDPDLIYLDGNSLGRLPAATAEGINSVVRSQWGEGLISSWNNGWWDLQLEVGAALAPILGAADDSVIISDSTSVNLHKLAAAAVAHKGKANIVTDDLNFPSDLYILDAVARAAGGSLQIVPSDGIHGPVAGLSEAVDGDTALLSLSHTTFNSGYTYDMAGVTAMAHEAGAMALWDCSHSVGVVPMQLDEWDVDLAVGCTYKYLNGGPGSPAFLFVRERLQQELRNPIQGWWAHEDPFALLSDFVPTEGMRRFHVGTMPILSLAAVASGLEPVLEAGVEAARHKSIALTEYFIETSESILSGLGFSLASPIDPARRGAHVTLTHEDAWPLTRALIEVGHVVPDFRAPDSMRFGLAPLYTSFTEVHTAVNRLRLICETGIHDQFRDVVSTVT